MSTLKATTIEPATGTNVTLGTTGDTVALPGNTLALDTWKDSGGNTLFTSNGSGVVSSVNSGLAGAGPVLIQSQTASGSANVSFTSGLDSTYDRYMFVFVNIHPSAHEEFTFNGSTDAGSNYNVTKTTTATSAYHAENGSGADYYYVAASDLANSTAYQQLAGNIYTDNDASMSGILHIFTPSSTTYVKHFYADTQRMDYSSVGYTNRYLTAGYLNTTSAVNAIDFKMHSGNFDGIIKLYGVK